MPLSLSQLILFYMQRRPIPGASKRHTNRARARSLRRRRRRTRSAVGINNAGLSGADTGTASEFFFFSLSLRGCSVSATQVVVGKHGKGERVGRGREAHYLLGGDGEGGGAEAR